MTLVDTSIWIDHLRAGDATLSALLRRGQVLTHPFVIGEIGLGSLRQRSLVLRLPDGLAQIVVVADADVLGFVTAHSLYGLGIGYVDAHLLAAVQRTPASKLWMRDKRLLAAAQRLSLDTAPVQNPV